MSTASTIEQEMLALINQERTSRGLEPLKLETNLNASAEDHSEWMLDADRFSHTGSNGSSATERMRDAGFDFSGSWRSGENIAWQSERGAPGISDDVAQLHQNLMNSPGHRANILNPDFEYIGIGIEEGDYNGWDAVMVTQNFATTDGEVVLDTGVAPAAPEEEVTDPQTPIAEVPEPDATETPATDLVEVEEPVDQTPETEDTPEVVATPVQETETPEPVAQTPVETAFDVDAFLASILEFFNSPRRPADEFELAETETADAAAEDDAFMLFWDRCEETPTESPPESVAADTLQNGFLWQIPVDDDYVMSFF